MEIWGCDWFSLFTHVPKVSSDSCTNHTLSSFSVFHLGEITFLTPLSIQEIRTWRKVGESEAAKEVGEKKWERIVPLASQVIVRERFLRPFLSLERVSCSQTVYQEEKEKMREERMMRERMKKKETLFNWWKWHSILFHLSSFSPCLHFSGNVSQETCSRKKRRK